MSDNLVSGLSWNYGSTKGWSEASKRMQIRYSGISLVKDSRIGVVVLNDIDFFYISEFLTQDPVAEQAKDIEVADFVLAAVFFPGETPAAPP